MICPKCKSENVTISDNYVTQSKSRSFLWNLLMICCTAGFWLVWMLVRRKKEKIVHIKSCVCQNCGKSWEI